MPTHNCTTTDLAAFGFIPFAEDLQRLCELHGYTNVTVAWVAPFDENPHTYDITLDEADSKATIITNMEAATVPTLSVNTAALQVAGDNVATGSITVSDSRGASASGKTVVLTVVTHGGMVLGSGTSQVLDGSGDASFSFGPSPSTNWHCCPMIVQFSYANNEAPAVTATVEFTR